MVDALESALNSPTGQAALLEISTTTKSGQMSKTFTADVPGTTYMNLVKNVHTVPILLHKLH